MASVAEWDKDNGTATGSPAKGTTRGVAADGSWKNVDDNTTVFSSSSVQQGNNSYEEWLCVKWTSTYNNIFTVLWAHTSGSFPSGVTLKGKTPVTYTTPSTSANANLTVDMTSPIAIGSGQTVNVGATGPEAAGHAASTNANPAYTDYLVTQCQTTSSATVGDSNVITQSVQWNEN